MVPMRLLYWQPLKNFLQLIKETMNLMTEIHFYTREFILFLTLGSVIVGVNRVPIAIPFLLNTEVILDLWLKDIPEYAVVFCQLMIY